MSQQINLYCVRLRPRREWLTGRNLAALALLTLAVVTALALWVGFEAERAGTELARVQGEVRTAQEQMVALTKRVSSGGISAGLQHELSAAKAALEMRSEVVGLLDSGTLGSDAGFSRLMTGFSRVAQSDLWLTGFSARRGGQEIEIRGSALDSTRLPGYVQRLSAEPVFQGLRFAALDVTRVDPAAEAVREATQRSARPVLGPAYVEFTLRSERAGAAENAPGGGK